LAVGFIAVNVRIAGLAEVRVDCFDLFRQVDLQVSDWVLELAAVAQNEAVVCYHTHAPLQEARADARLREDAQVAFIGQAVEIL